MPAGRPLPSVARYTCTILTCDPTTTPPTIEAQLKGADARSVSIIAVPNAFRWPEVGETWVIRQENGSWYLDGRALDSSDALPISSLQTGQMRLDATEVLDANGNVLLASKIQIPLTGTAWIAPTLINSWANLASSTPAGYLKDPLGFVHLRGRLLGGASNTTAFVLPIGYRPANLGANGDTYGAGVFNGSTPVAGGVNILGNGHVDLYYVTGATNIGLGGITFLAEN